VRLGVLPRDASGQMQPDWYDLGLPGFVWHCVGAQEEGDRVTCWMPIFEDYSSEVPIHLAHEPESYLYSACAQEDSTSLCTPFYTALSLFMCTQ
jgi:carotenoid cleavage dioxygenase-like enzyme